MEWKVYASRKDYEADDGGTRGKSTATETGEKWDDAPQGVWATRPGEVMPIYVRKRPGKGKPFYYRIEGEAAPAAPKPRKAKAAKGMEPLF